MFIARGFLHIYIYFYILLKYLLSSAHLFFFFRLQIILCETNNFELCGSGRIAARTCKGDMMREIRLLTALQDTNLIRVFGVCTAEQPPWLIMEYAAEYGDILFLLQNRSNIKLVDTGSSLSLVECLAKRATLVKFMVIRILLVFFFLSGTIH